MIIGIVASGVRRALGSDEYRVRIQVAAGKVSADQAKYPLYVDLSTLPTAFIGGIRYKDGRDIRAYNAAGDLLPLDVVSVNLQEGTGALFVATPLSATTGAEVYLGCGPDRHSHAVDAPAGRNAVWSEFHRVFAFAGDLDDRTGKGSNLYISPANPAFQGKEVATSPNVLSHQGVCWDGSHYYVVDTNRITKYDLSWTQVADNSNPLSGISDVNHCGDPEIRNGVLYIPIEMYTSVTNWSGMKIATYSASDLSFISFVDISANNHEVSSIAWIDDLGEFVVTSYADKDRQTLYRYNEDLVFTGTISLSSAIYRMQGITSINGDLYISSNYSVSGKFVYRVKMDGQVLAPVWGMDGTIEGVGKKNGNLLILVDVNGDANGVVHEVKLEQSVAGGGAVFPLAASGKYGYYIAAGVTRYTAWTLGLSYMMREKAAVNQAIVSYNKSGSGANSNRTGLAWQNTQDRIGLWNDTDKWIYESSAPVIGTMYRYHAVQNGTTGRSIYRDGTVTASGPATALMPSPISDQLQFGVEDIDVGERASGVLGLAYLYPGVLSATRINAEAQNLNTPSSFYSVSLVA